MTAMVEKQAGMIGTTIDGMTIKEADMFAYNDPIDGSVSKNQGVRVLFADGSRVIFRLSGTGSVGATVRMYIEKYVPPTGALHEVCANVVGDLVKAALELSSLVKFTGMESPTVIT